MDSQLHYGQQIFTGSSCPAYTILWELYYYYTITIPFSSVQFSHLVMSDSLRPHESQHARPPCPSPTPRVYSNSCPSSQWCHPAISSSIVPLSSCPQSLPASGSFPMSKLFTWGGQSIGVSASASVLPVNTQDWSPLGWTGWIFLWVQGTLKSLLQHHSSEASILRCSALFTVQLSHPYMTTGKTIALNRWTFVGKVMSLLLNMLSRLVITFLPRSKCLLISWLRDFGVILFFYLFVCLFVFCSDFGAQKNKVIHCFHCFPIYFPWSDGTRCHNLSFLNVVL